MPRNDRPRGNAIRPPVMAGRFYPDDPEQCSAEVRRYLTQDVSEDSQVPAKWLGGIVPHAGWICSGAIAGKTIRAIGNANSSPDIVVIFGAVHSPYRLDHAALDTHDAWRDPTGDTEVDAALQRKLKKLEWFAVDERFHREEHAIEVELPLVREMWPEARIVPIEIPAIDRAVEIGRAVAEQASKEKLNAIYLASSDLTHYGPSYRFAPAGLGQAGLDWAKDNDRRLLDQVLNLEENAIVPEAAVNLNACGAGAIAAMLAACKAQGANRAELLQHASSYETLKDVAPQPPTNAVGYASVVVGS